MRPDTGYLFFSTFVDDLRLGVSAVNIALGPMTNMGRVAKGGRNWEGFGEE